MTSSTFAGVSSKQSTLHIVDDVETERSKGRRPFRRLSGQRWWNLKLRSFDNEGEQDWWFASTAIPLLAATIAPLANVFSIAALVTYWRQDLLSLDGEVLTDLEGIPFRDPRWCYWLNVVSLILGFVGNFFLLMNFTGRVRYIIALPVTIVLWYLATSILIGITVSMNVYVPPLRPYQSFTEGYWYAVIATALYFICSMILMVNMLGYFLGHYPQRFDLTDHQRTLILQTMIFFIWLAGGAAVFARVETDLGEEGWAFVDALYFCDVTILTIGFGDLYATNDTGRGLVFPYSVGGIVMLGLVISSITKFLAEIGEDKVIKRHAERERVRTIDRTVSDVAELERRNGTRQDDLRHGSPSGEPTSEIEELADERISRVGLVHRVSSRINSLPRIRSQQTKLRLLRGQKDRFEEMRRIQYATAKFKRWSALGISVTAFAILWAVGAVVFWQIEEDAQGMTYFKALYFCYVSLLTIGYGDLAPKSSAGRPFFVVWSLLAIPTMTILINSMAKTVIVSFNQAAWQVADFTLLPREGVWRDWWRNFGYNRRMRRKSKPAPAPLAPVQNQLTSTSEAISVDHLPVQVPTEIQSARDLALAIRRVAKDLKSDHPRKYSYEEWVEFSRLIRFTAHSTPKGVLREEEEQGLLEWDWIGEDSPMMSEQSEAEFVLDRLCESLMRYIRRHESVGHKGPDLVRTPSGLDTIEEKVSPGGNPG